MKEKRNWNGDKNKSFGHEDLIASRSSSLIGKVL